MNPRPGQRGINLRSANGAAAAGVNRCLLFRGLHWGAWGLNHVERQLMMRGIRRLVVYTAVSGLLAAGAVSVTMEVAHADSVVGHCIGASDSTPTAFACTVTGHVATPTAITVSVTDNSSNSTNEDVTVSYTFTCTDNTATSPSATGGETG